MSVLAELRLPPDDFALEETFDSFPDLVLRVQQATAQPVGLQFSLCWFRNVSGEGFERALRRDPTITDAWRLTGTDWGDLFGVRWCHRVRRLIRAFAIKGTIVETVATRRNWTLSLLFEDHRHASELHATLRDREFPFTLERLSAPTGPLPNPDAALTPKQREILCAAVESGFYDVPRRADMNELADRLGISQQAASTRLRRAHAALVRNTIPELDDGAAPD